MGLYDARTAEDDTLQQAVEDFVVSKLLDSLCEEGGAPRRRRSTGVVDVDDPVDYGIFLDHNPPENFVDSAKLLDNSPLEEDAADNPARRRNRHPKTLEEDSADNRENPPADNPPEKSSNHPFEKSSEKNSTDKRVVRPPAAGSENHTRQRAVEDGAVVALVEKLLDNVFDSSIDKALGNRVRKSADNVVEKSAESCADHPTSGTGAGGVGGRTTSCWGRGSGGSKRGRSASRSLGGEAETSGEAGTSGKAGTIGGGGIGGASPPRRSMWWRFWKK